MMTFAAIMADPLFTFFALMVGNLFVLGLIFKFLIEQHLKNSQELKSQISNHESVRGLNEKMENVSKEVQSMKDYIHRFELFNREVLTRVDTKVAEMDKKLDKRE